MRRALSCFALLLGIISMPASATIAVVAQYHLGEADPGAIAGGPGANPTLASVGSPNLTKLGTPIYASDVPIGIGSTLSMAFNGTTDQYMAAGVASTLTDNFGIEAWVKSNGSTAANAAIAYNGNSGPNGWGIYRFGGNYGLLYGGNILLNGPAITTQWTELAVVRASGTTTFYVNGVANFTTAAGPNAPAGGVGIGGNSTNAGFELFDGKIDEVRIFSFAPGQFAVSDLNLPVLAPVAAPATSPGTLAMLGFGLLMLAGFALRRRA
jgi:hypothetical protein